MRVLLVAHALPPAALGGTELYTRDLAATLAAQGHDVAVTAPAGADGTCPKPATEHPDVAAFELPDPDGETAPAVGERPLDAVNRPDVDDRFRALLAEWKPDVVHFQHLKHLSANLPVLCERRGVACVATLHDFWTLCHREQLYRPEGHPCSGPESVGKCADCYRRAATNANRAPADGVQEGETPDGEATDGGVAANEASARSRVRRRDDALADALAATDRLVAPSAFLRELFVAYGTSPEAIVQRRNGVRVERFDVTGFDPDGPLRVGYAGRITERKGVHLLVEAIEAVDGASLDVFGRFDPESDPYHRDLAESAGDDATFRGRYADRAAPYRAMDVLVLPSLWYENSPLVIQEAFASGVPVVTADVGGMAELVADGADGLTFPVGDADALAGALARLAESPALVERFRDGVTAPKRLVDHAREIADLYADCADGAE